MPLVYEARPCLVHISGLRGMDGCTLRRCGGNEAVACVEQLLGQISCAAREVATDVYLLNPAMPRQSQAVNVK